LRAKGKLKKGSSGYNLATLQLVGAARNKRPATLPQKVMSMSHRNLFVLLCILIATFAFGQTARKSAHADIVNAQGQKIGTAIFSPAGGGVKIDVDVAQLPPGTHGIHIHAVGKCEGPDFKSAGGHLNPDAKEHGKDNPKGPHAGDLMNIEVDAGGQAKASLSDSLVTLGGGPNSLFHEGGSALVIHEKADDYKTDPAGNAGARIACGVIQE
jgi:Cu-Zn family superoxide dismutase